MNILALAVLLCMGGPLGNFDAFDEEFAAKRKGIKVVEATYLQEDIVPGNKEITKGVLLYAKPRRIVLRSIEPETVKLVDGRRIFEYIPEIKQLEINDLGDSPEADIFFFAFDSDTESLRKAYDVSLFEIKNTEQGKKGVLIKPKADEAEDALFEEVSLYLRDEDYLPYRIEMVFDEDSKVVIHVQKYTVNGTPDAAQTQILAAEGTKIIDNGVVLDTVGPGGIGLPDALHFGAPEEGPEEATIEVEDLDEP